MGDNAIDSPVMRRRKQTQEKEEELNKRAMRCAFMLTTVIAGMGIYYYNKLTACPPQPELDLQEWWGPYPIDMVPDITIRPYTVEFSDVIVNDLKERLLHRRPFTPPLENSFNFGFNTGFLTRVLDFWQNNYNFQERERFLNKYPNFVTNIQGLDIHFIHVKPDAPSDVAVIPILLIHGWPSSVREFYEIIPLLTTTRTNQEFVFEVIVPSLPGFGFSQAPVRPGMGPIEVSVILNNLMTRIGHKKYYIHGGSYGQSIGSAMATIFHDNILGLHCNMPIILGSPFVLFNTVLGSLWADWSLEPEIKNRIYPLSHHAAEMYQESGYFHIQATKPDTIGIGLTESPAGLASYILEKFSSWTNLEYRNASDGGLIDKFHLTQLLDNVMIYWSTNSITTSMRHYIHYCRQMMLVDMIATDVPTSGIRFKFEFPYTLDYFFKKKYINYLRSTNVADGGQFPAMELPQVLADDMYDAVSGFRKFHAQPKPWWYLEKPSTDEILIDHDQLQSQPQQKNPEPEATKTVYDFIVKDINGNEVNLEKYKGKVLIIVNVASQCGYTDTHYTQLNELYEKYAEKDLRILAFPCNQFGGQEPGSLTEILKFTQNRNVKFDVFEKIDVNGENTHPLWEFLKEAQSGTFGNFIKWNFSKFIVDRHGVPVERFGPNVNPVDLEPYLTKYL